ncbi:alpha/beta hydrolase [Actinospica durhamensis]|uniref:Alpha/beta hydrolase n=1 Tax=Actinospica durhamensis TaxID=1508375 RepID=A0A941IR81_9ACTN|nr:alpha/beta hydrolase [Actinospica durhamensis]MBR7837074.1 alpha/beta hydrolase [Actinospica durhamensis]
MGELIETGAIRIYHEVHGSGEPVVLLHGGMASIDLWQAQTAALSPHYRVYLPERRGHGRTPDVPGPITYELMAADTVAYLDRMELARVDLVGWSDGALIAALVALAHPDRVRKLVLIGQYFNPDGQRPEARVLQESFARNPPAMLKDLYATLSPDGPDHFGLVFAKMLHMLETEPNIALETLAQISAPTLIMQGDDDAVTVEHSAAAARAIPDAQLAVLPGTTHAAPLEKPDLINRLILDFLADTQTPKLMPLS